MEITRQKVTYYMPCKGDNILHYDANYGGMNGMPEGLRLRPVGEGDVTYDWHGSIGAGPLLVFRTAPSLYNREVPSRDSITVIMPDFPPMGAPVVEFDGMHYYKFTGHEAGRWTRGELKNGWGR